MKDSVGQAAQGQGSRMPCAAAQGTVGTPLSAIMQTHVKLRSPHTTTAQQQVRLMPLYTESAHAPSPSRSHCCAHCMTRPELEVFSFAYRPKPVSK